MATGPWTVFDQFMFEKDNNDQDIINDTFYITLVTISHIPNTVTDLQWSDISADEVPTNYGYTQGGIEVIPSLTKGDNNIAFAFTNNIGWIANGGTISAAWAVIKNNTTGGIVAYAMLDDTNGAGGKTVDITNTNAYNIDLITNGIFNESRV